MPTLVFVFGTLKEGFPNFGTNRGKRIQGRFVTQERFPLYLVGTRHSPWMLDAPGEGSRVAGELFEVSDAVLADMDRLERVTEPDGYVRKSIVVRAEGPDQSASLSAEAYLKRADALVQEDVRLGPLAEYTLEHASLYRPRAA